MMELHNLRKTKPIGNTTWGCIWKQGECSKATSYVCTGESGGEVEMQTRITAYWPDGSVKWTSHTADAATLGNRITVRAEKGETAENKETDTGIVLTETEENITIDTGCFVMYITKNSSRLFDRVEADKKIALENAEPVLELEQPLTQESDGYKQAPSVLCAAAVKKYRGAVEKVTLEEVGKLQVIVKYEGIHRALDGEEKIPFIIRMTLGRNQKEIKFMHTFLYDGDENRDFLKGIGIRFEKPMEGAFYNRHIKVMGDHGVFHETALPMISWRPKVPAGLYERQMQGELLQLEGQEKEVAECIIKDAPHWNEYNICQDSPSHFLISKKLKGENLCEIDCLHGVRTSGGIAVGAENGSVMMAVRDFWEKYPAGYRIKGLDDAKAECTIWFYSPKAQAYDFRHYAERGYNQVCYEGYDYKGADPVGIACTGECAVLLCSELIPEDEAIALLCDNVNHPALYVGDPAFYHERRAFGFWSLPSGETPMERWLEEQMENAFTFYKNEVEQRNWYGIMNYGDFMHTYDGVRHQWRYDIGGYAWDNTELVPTLWLWLYFMRSGREDVFTLAEKLSRHASEVDVYHFGKYKGLGSRHNVRHWGCPCKEARIAMAAHHRFLYYLTDDRRLEDIFDELKDNELSFLNRDPLGDFYNKSEMVYPSHARSGPDWSSLCSNWMTEWERTENIEYRQKIVTGLEDIKAAPLKLSSGPDFEFDPHSLHLRYIGECTTGGCHLQICMGAPQIWLELADWLEDEEFKDMLAQHGRFYYLSHEEQLAESGGIIGNRESTLPFMNAALGAYGAQRLKLPQLAEKTWEILLQTLIFENNSEGFAVKGLKDCGNHELLSEIPWISTNFTAQWCLNVIMTLEFIRDFLPETVEEVMQLVKDGKQELFRKA
ncbi:MAG: hypothetical protein NC321_04585 [Clostridium sp.]|nr:hypothetical protein [Clostridium sp.]